MKLRPASSLGLAPLALAALLAAGPLACKSTSGSSERAVPVKDAADEPRRPADLPPLSPGARTEDERNTIGVFRAAADATVFVTQKARMVDFYGNTEEVAAGSGSGFVWDKQGHIVTNYHVVADGLGNRGSFTVTFQNQKVYNAKVVGVEPRKDIAVLKLDAPEELLHPVKVPTDVHLEVGQKTIAIGNPFGLDHSLTTGVISALGRQVMGAGNVTIRDMIQTDAAINPGNSGGPLLDSGGQLIGMNTMIFSKSGSSAGIGFAVPVSTIAKIVPQIIKSGKAEQIGIGVSLFPPGFERRLGVEGVLVKAVTGNSPAAKAGLRGTKKGADGEVVLGDVITAVDGQKIKDYDDLYNAIDRHTAGEKVELTVKRGEETVTLKGVELVVLDL